MTKIRYITSDETKLFIEELNHKQSGYFSLVI